VNTLKRITVGTRTSPLSLIQTEEILRPLRAHYPDIEFAIVPIATAGDRHKGAPLLSMARGMFAKDVEMALLDGEIDFAVHSAKDLTTTLPDGLVIAAIGQRLDPRDVLVDRWNLPLNELPTGARIGTSSPRRTAQLKALRPDIEVLPIRGNVGTRINKAQGDEYDGVVLAAAGLLRLGRESEISEHLSPEVCTPEVGQGALAVEARADDTATIEVLAKADHWPSSVAVRAERAFLAAVGGGCKVPVTAYARLDGGELHILAMAATPDGSRLFRAQAICDASDPESAGRRAAEVLARAGASEIMSRSAER
jgi:hydroxymethylbilane synthase